MSVESANNSISALRLAGLLFRGRAHQAWLEWNRTRNKN